MTRRTSPPRWLWAVWFMALVLIVVIRRVVDMGDSGLTNVASFAVFLLAAIFGVLWFVFRSAYSARLRYGSLLGLIVLVWMLPRVVEVRGWSGEMVPALGLRGGGADAPPRRGARGRRRARALSARAPDDRRCSGRERRRRR